MDISSEMHFIVDGSGNYYRVNDRNELVAVDNREDASVFSFVEANQRIGGGKKAHFYSVIPVKSQEERKAMLAKNTTMEMLRETEPDKEHEMEFNYDRKHIDWGDYLTHFCDLTLGIKDYQEELKHSLTDLEMQICDIMHYIELYDMDEFESIRMVDLLKECREQRRDVKDEIIRVECFQKSIGTRANVTKVKEEMGQIKKLSTRTYHPRKLRSLFKNCPQETIRQSKLLKALDDTTCMEKLTEHCESYEISNEEEKGAIMEYTKQMTIFDGIENDWLQFAKQQEEFYANAEQYIFNLQMDLNELDEEIERILGEVEDANYNVAQGYHVFKQLKELRVTKKNKQKELECLYILTYGVDCERQAEIMRDCVDKMESLFAKPGQGESESGVMMVG